jgi:hypothetical protein
MGWSGRAPAPPAIEAGKGRRDNQTQAELRKSAAESAAEYVAEAEDIESKDLASRIAARERGRQLRRPLGETRLGW